MSQVPSTATSSTDFEPIFSAALEAYKRQTKKDIAAHPLAAQLQSCDSPSAILAVLRSQVQRLDRSHSANQRLTKWLDPTVNVLYAFSATLGNSVGLIFPPSNAIFAGIGVLLQAVKDVRASQNILVDLFGHMEYSFKRLEAYIEVRPTAAMTDIIVKIMIEVLSILGIVTKEIGRGRMKRYLTRLVGRKDVEDALQRLDRLTQEEARMAAAEVLTITRGIDDKVEGVDHKVGSVIERVKENGVGVRQVANQVRDLNRNELRKDLRKWIAPPDPSVNFNTASGAHHEGTSAWCTKGNTLADWKKSGSLLWVHGKLGSGKSILSSVIIRDIKSLSNAGSACMAYFFFDFKDTGKQDSRALLSSILVQLSERSEQFCDILLGLHTAHQNGLEQPTDDSLTRCLKEMLTIMGQVPIYLIMDALDECPNDSGIPSSREKVLELVKELVELRYPNLRLFVTSRPEFDIRTALGPLATQQISLHDESGQQQDIIDYVTSVVRSDKKMKRWRDDDKNLVIEKLTKKVDGMFRWVFCQLEVLRQSFPTNLRRVLEELPKSLDETYKRILKEINNANREHAHRLLQCLTVARRPLRVEELAEVLAFDLNTGGIAEFIEDWRWEDREEAVLSACSSLVSVIIDNGSRVVQFSHISVKEFLTSDRLASSMEDVSRFHIPIELSHVILAQACLGDLLRLDDRTDKESVRRIPLFRYATQYWDGHAQVGNVESHIKDALDCFSDMEKPHFSAWVRIGGLHYLSSVSLSRFEQLEQEAVPLSAAPLYFAAGNGLRGLVERLIIKHPQQVNLSGGVYGTPLHASVFGGHIEVSQLLFAHGANINSRSADNWTPLHLASLEGHLEVGKWLLNLGVDVNLQKDGWTPLHFAASNGHLEVAQLLLEHKAEVNSRDDCGATSLLEASANGHRDIVRLLLDHNADANAHDNDGVTPLHWAASCGHLEVARILLEHHAEVNSRTNQGYTPFLVALRRGNSDVVWLLLGYHADADVHDNNRVTPLHLAASCGHLEVARMLLERNADANAQDNQGYTPLLNASVNEICDVVRLLLDHNADVHVRDKHGNTPLHLAVSKGRLEVARILLEHHAGANVRNDQGSTPFLVASKRGKSDVVQLLLGYNADVRVHDKNGVTPLHFAASFGHLEVSRILLEHHAEVNARDDQGSTPFLAALKRGNSDVVRLLLGYNADADVRDNNGVTPLHLAASCGNLKVVQILLKCNVEVNSRDGRGFTPLFNASVNGNRSVVWLLLDHDADAHVCDNNGATPLHLAASFGRLGVTRILLKRSAEVNAQDDQGHTSLLFASAGGHLGVVRLLLDHNAHAHVRGRDGFTPLHCAAANGHLEVALILLEHNAEVDSRNDLGFTPLLIASANGYPDVVRLLLDHSADAYVRDNKGNTALHWAANGNYLEVAQILLECNVEANSLNDDGSTPLHRASEGFQKGLRDIVRLLLDHGADARVRNLSGKTASEIARGTGQQEIVQMLSKHSAERTTEIGYGIYV